MNGKIIYGIADQLSAHCWTTSHHAFLTRCNWIVQKATGVLGSHEAAERWLTHPAFGLGHQAPCTILGTSEGYTEVYNYLCRIEYCIYT